MKIQEEKYQKPPEQSTLAKLEIPQAQFLKVNSDIVQFILVMQGSLMLDLTEQQQKQQQQQLYNQQRFVQLLQMLHEKSILYYCPYDQATLKIFYHQIIIREQTELLTLDVVHQFISELKQRNREELGKENQYYEAIMRQNLMDGIEVVSKKQFRKIMDKFMGEMGTITQILIENSKNAEFVSCQLVLELLNQVKVEIEDAVVPELSITKLKTLRLNVTQNNQENPQSSIILPLFGQIEEFQIKRLLEQYSRNIRRKLNFYKEFIADAEILQDLDTFQQALVGIEKDIANEVEEMIEVNKSLNNQCQEFDGKCNNLAEEINMQSELTLELQQKIEELKEELNISEDNNRRLAHNSNELESVATETQAELVNISKHCEQLQAQLEQYKSNYRSIYQQYEKVVEASQRKSMINKEQENKKIFTTRSLKEQLDDTAHRLNRILAERQKQRKQNQEIEENNTNRILLLEAKLDDLQRQLKEKNQYLCEYVRQSKMLGSRISGFRMSKLNETEKNRFSDRVSATNPIQEKQQPKEQPKDRQSRLSSASVVQRFSATNTSKLNRIKIAVMQPIQQQEVDFDDLVQSFSQQNIIDIVKEDTVASSVLAFKKNKQSPVKQTSPQKAATPKYKCFYSKGLIINNYGRKFETWILLTSKRFCYFDTKVRLNKFLPIDSIKEFVFTTQTPNIFIIKPLNYELLNPEKHIVHDMIFSTRNITKLQNYLYQLKATGQCNANVSVKKAENTWLKVNSNEYNLKMSIPNTNNPFRVCLGTQAVFYAQVKQQGIFSSKVDSVIIIQPMGMVCFQGNEEYEIDDQRNFVCLLPFVEDMKLNVKTNSKEAPNRKIIVEYKSYNKSYQIIFRSKEDTQMFKKAADLQRDKNKEYVQELKNKMMKKFQIQA